jgi:hypothetical protein
MAQPARKIKAGFGDMLKTATTKKKATSKSKIPVIDASDHIKEAVDRYITATKAYKEAEAEKKEAGGTIIDFTCVRQDDDGYNNNFRHSYSIPGMNDSQVKFVSSNRFSINAEDAGQIEEILGDKFSELIEQKFTVKLRPEIFEDSDLQEELMNRLGDRFAVFFETVTSLKVCDEFDRKVYQAVDSDSLAALRTFCRPYTPSLRG